MAPTLADQLAVPMVMLVCTGVITLVGFLLSYQLRQRDQTNTKQSEDIEELKGKMIQVRTVLGLRDRPSDSVLKKQGESSA